jgi:hypothetical protein
VEFIHLYARSVTALPGRKPAFQTLSSETPAAVYRFAIDVLSS